ncbi:hypothetical protein [Flavobacterium terrisoli]|uniref:hypothetical protein n=1 Tax=Flavobacterium terrisoli TaxID=3242195 RepID=UPI002542861D|nr:hypothetical protein [Flavobacterium buctense]
MKFFIALYCFLSCLKLDIQEVKLEGTYKIEFTQKSYQKDCNITFNGNAFTMRDSRFLPYTGTISYSERLTSISSEFNSDIIIDFKTNEIGKDTIYFLVHDKKATPMNYLDISVNSGRMIKVK